VASFSLRCLPVFSIGLLLVGCQGDAPAPVAPDRTIDGAAAIKCGWDKSVTDIYENKFKSDKAAACKDAAEFVDAGDLTAAELVINELLAALYNDYAVCVGLPFGTQDLATCPFKGGASVDPAGVVTFAQATCDIASGLPQTGDVDCVVPTIENLAAATVPPTNPTAEKAAGWIVAGPVVEGTTVVLPSGEFGVELDALTVASVYVAIRENAPTSVVGECPVNSDNDCVQNNYTVDMDGVGEAYDDNDPIADSPDPGLYVEICEGPAPFAEFSVPARCESSSNTCAPAESVAPRGLLSCSKGALAFAPSTWTAADGALAVRDVVCKVNSQSAAISEGTTCTILTRGPNAPVEVVDSCLTIATPEVGPKAAECTIPDILAANLDGAHDGSPVLYTMEAAKIESGVSHFGSTDFELSQTDPIFGNVREVFVDVLPPGQQ
jgi:hypothetical protein